MREIDKEKEKFIHKGIENPHSKIKSFDELACAKEKEDVKNFDNMARQKAECKIKNFDNLAKEKHDEIESRKIIADGINEGLHKTYDQYLDSGKQKLNIVEKTQFQNSNEFKERLRQKSGITEKELNYIHGYFDPKDGKIYVNDDASKKHICQVVSHEGSHLLSNPEFRQRYGERLNEGVNEYLSRKANKPLEIKDIELHFDEETGNLKEVEDITPHYYEEESQIAEMINQHAPIYGQGTLEKAYFRGGEEDIFQLSEAVDKSTGIKGAMAQVNEHLENAYKYQEGRQFREAEKEYKQCFDILKSQKKMPWEK